MKQGQIRLYLMNTEKLSDYNYFQQCCSELSDFRQRKINRYRFFKDKKLSLGAGLLLDEGLKVYGLREADVKIDIGKNGKPYIVDYPEINFNLSHSMDLAFAVFADKPVGCDIEYVKEADLRLAKRFFCSVEYEYIMSMRGKERDKAFYRIWTLKESFVKATGIGMKLSANPFEFDLCKTEQGFVQSYGGEEYSFKEYELAGYCAAVCARGQMDGFIKLIEK